MEPPPAATVWMLIIGARMRTPATCVSKARSNSPAKWLTSVEVPPMSKPITLSPPRSFFASCAVRTMPTMPPAGPERIASLPWKAWASVRPPLLCMKNSFTPGISPATCST